MDEHRILPSLCEGGQSKLSGVIRGHKKKGNTRCEPSNLVGFKSGKKDLACVQRVNYIFKKEGAKKRRGNFGCHG